MTDQVKELFDILMCNYDFSAMFAESLAKFLTRTFEGRTSNYCCMCGVKMTEETNNEKV